MYRDDIDALRRITELLEKICVKLGVDPSPNLHPQCSTCGLSQRNYLGDYIVPHCGRYDCPSNFGVV